MATSYPRTQWDPGPVQSFLGFADNTAGIAPGKAIHISVTAGITVVLTFPDGTFTTVNPVTGDNIYPYSVTKAVASDATKATYTNLM